MSSPLYANTPNGFTPGKPVGFIAATGTAAKVVIEPQTAAVAVPATPSPDFYGGATILDLRVSSTDSVAKSLLLWMGEVQTTASITITLSSQNLLTRASGSYITDGWRVGDQVMIFAPFGSAQVAAGIDGIAGTITAVAALTLTVNGTPWASGSNVLTTGSRLVNISQIIRAAVPANSGNADGTNPVFVISNTISSALIPQEVKLGASTVVAASLVAAASALPAVVSVTSSIARY